MFQSAPVQRPSSVAAEQTQSESWQSLGGVALRILTEIDRKRPKLVASVPVPEQHTGRLKAA